MIQVKVQVYVNMILEALRERGRERDVELLWTHYDDSFDASGSAD